MKTTSKTIPLFSESGLTCFLIPGIFSEKECSDLLNEKIKDSFTRAISNYPVYYRNNDRFVKDDEAAAVKLFEKIKEFLPAEIDYSSSIPEENGKWKLKELNKRLRYCRYLPGQYFNRHLDGVHHRSETIQSKLTFMIYLNGADEFTGGRTLFYNSKQDTIIRDEYTPKKGDLIIFDHNIWHEGETLQNGIKYVLRSDILYEKICGADEAEQMNYSEGHLGYIWAMLDLNETTVVSGGRDKTIKTWRSGRFCTEFNGAHENSVLCLEKLSDTIFISGSRDKTIKAWKADEGKLQLLWSIQIHDASVLSLKKISDNTFLSSAADFKVKLCDFSGKIRQEFIGHAGWVWDIVNLSDTTFISSSDDKTTIVWNLNGEIISNNADISPVVRSVYIKEKSLLISGCLDGTIIYRILTESGELIESRKFDTAHNGIIRCLIALDYNWIASGGEDNKIRVWEVNTGKCAAEFSHANFVQSLLFKNDKLISSSYDGKIKEWDLDFLKMT